MSSQKEKIIQKINALLAKTQNSGCTEAETKSALEKANQLMAQYAIEQGEVGIKQEICTKCTVLFHSHLSYVATALAEMLHLESWIANRRRHLIAFGLPKDVELFEYFYMYIFNAIEAELKQFKESHQYKGIKSNGVHGRTLCRSFRYGMAERIGIHIEGLTGAQRGQHEADSQGGTSLVALKNAVVSEQFAALGLSFKSRRSQANLLHAASFRAGEAAGQRVQLNRGLTH